MDIENGGGFTETTSQSYCSKLGDAFVGVCIGLLLFFGSIGVLAWNEGRTVKRSRDLDEGRLAFVKVPLQDVVQYQDKLIYTTGPVSTTDPLTDPIFGVNASSSTNPDRSTLKLARNVEMFQWQERQQTKERKTNDGSTVRETTYSYDRVWSSRVINSNQFYRQTNNLGQSVANPNHFPYPPEQWVAEPIQFGQLTLPDDIVSQLNWFESVSPLSLNAVPDASLRNRLSLESSSTFFLKVNDTALSSNNDIGDTRFTFSAVLSDNISVVAQVSASTFTAYDTANGGKLLLVERGIVSPEDMFQKAENANTTLAWILRFVGFGVMFISILLILSPISTAFDIVPFVGSFIGDQCLEGCIFPLIAIMISLPLSIFIVMLAWIAHRPVFAIPAALACLALLIYICMRARNVQARSSSKPQQQSYDELEKKQQPYDGEPEVPFGEAYASAEKNSFALDK